MDDVYEPLARYRDEFKDKFAALTKQKFQSLVKESGIDVNANRKQVGVVCELEAELASANNKRGSFGLLMALCYVCAAIGFGVALANQDGGSRGLVGWSIMGGIVGLGLAIWLTTLFCRFGDIVKNLEAKVAAAKEIAWKQMAPLNRLYTWDITTQLIQETVPSLTFDPYFTSQRLADLKRLYGWNDSFNEERSVVFAQSGVINGNPFLIGEFLEMEWGTETYTGELEIEWEEAVEDSEGNVRYETRSEVLTASVDKPIPRYSKQKILIYGNDAAPSLTFSRQSSSLSGAESGFITSMRKKWRLGRMKSLSRDLDNSSFRLMANHEFETLFNCTDRDNEVEFRLLYTALAQIQTLTLLKDKTVGFGDDFNFCKQRRLNFIYSKHLNDATIDTAPETFFHWDYDSAAQTFLKFNQKYFKDVYFALAPLLAIPLYQQTRTHEDIWKGVSYTAPSSFWEHEATANYFGGSKFEHPDCITENILKTRVVARSGGVSQIEVTAYGYRGISRVDYETVLGGDGNFHDVPVEWVEYMPVSNTSDLIISEGHTPTEEFASGYRSAAVVADRRHILSFIPGMKRRDGGFNRLPVSENPPEGICIGEASNSQNSKSLGDHSEGSPVCAESVGEELSIDLTMIVCPCCGEQLEAPVNIQIGQHVICPYCEKKFSYRCEESPTAESPADNSCKEEFASNDNIVTSCPQCGELLKVSRTIVEGQHIKCPNCSSRFAYSRDGDNVVVE